MSNRCANLIPHKKVSDSRPGQHVPPPLSIDDRGLRWKLDGEIVTLVRRPTFTNALIPIGIVGVTLVIASQGFLQGSWLTVAFSSILFFLALVGLVVRLRIRVDLRAGPEGVEWNGVGAHVNKGRWTKESITAVRVSRGRRPTRWGAHAIVNTELRVNREWVSLAWGHNYDRSLELARDMATALHLPSPTIEESHL